MSPLPPIITLEEHYLSPLFSPPKFNAELGLVVPKLSDLHEERIANMDAGSVTLQVLSHVPVDPTAPSTDLARSMNDELHVAIQSHPKRLAAFAILPMENPNEAADELTRTTKELHFVGALINNHLNGRFYDDAFFWPLFERAEALDVPIYIHPTFPDENTLPQYQGNYSERAAFMLGISAWGWHADTGLHILRLFASGLFDKYPKLKIVIGHMGEMIPYMLDRIVPMSERGWGQRERGLRQVSLVSSLWRQP